MKQAILKDYCEKFMNQSDETIIIGNNQRATKSVSADLVIMDDYDGQNRTQLENRLRRDPKPIKFVVNGPSDNFKVIGTKSGRMSATKENLSYKLMDGQTRLRAMDYSKVKGTRNKEFDMKGTIMGYKGAAMELSSKDAINTLQGLMSLRTTLMQATLPVTNALMLPFHKIIMNDYIERNIAKGVDWAKIHGEINA